MFIFKKKNKKYDSSTIADYIIAYYASNDKENINVTKTLKILYLTYGIYLYKNKEVLFDEMPQAWAYGPVFAKARKHILKNKTYQIDPSDEKFNELKNDKKFLDAFNETINNFGDWTSTELVDFITNNDTAWRLSYTSKEKNIDLNQIFIFFSNLIYKKNENIINMNLKDKYAKMRNNNKDNKKIFNKKSHKNNRLIESFNEFNYDEQPLDNISSKEYLNMYHKYGSKKFTDDAIDSLYNYYYGTGEDMLSFDTLEYIWNEYKSLKEANREEDCDVEKDCEIIYCINGHILVNQE